MDLKGTEYIPLPPLVREAMVLESSPERVIETLKERALKRLSPYRDDEWFMPDLDRKLLSKNNRLIDLGLAAYGYDENVKRTLFHRAADDLQIRVAVLGNRGQRYSTYPYYLFDSDVSRNYEPIGISLCQFLAAAEAPEIEAMFSNPTLKICFLLSFFEGKAEWQALPEDTQRMALRALSRGKVISQAVEDSNIWSDGSILLDLAWNLCAQVPVNVAWAHTMAEFMQSLPTRWCKIENFDEKLLRWVASDETEVKSEIADNKIGELSEFQKVRLFISKAHLWPRGDDGLKHEDIAVRLAAYSMSRMTKEQVQQAIKTDGILTLDSFLENEPLWENNEVRDLIEELEKKADGDSGLLIERKRYQLKSEELEKKHPEWFMTTLNETPENEENSNAMAALIASQAELKKRITTLTWAIGVLAVVIYFW